MVRDYRNSLDDEDGWPLTPSPQPREFSPVHFCSVRLCSPWTVVACPQAGCDGCLYRMELAARVESPARSPGMQAPVHGRRSEGGGDEATSPEQELVNPLRPGEQAQDPRFPMWVRRGSTKGSRMLLGQVRGIEVGSVSGERLYFAAYEGATAEHLTATEDDMMATMA